MSKNNIKDGLSAIAKEVLQDVDKEAATLIQEAVVQAKETLRLAKETADQTYGSIMDEAAVQTQAERHQIYSVTNVEVRNRLLQTKEALVEEAFKKASVKLQELIGTEGYHENLLHLIEEAVQKMNAESLVLRLNVADKAWLTKEKLGQLSKKLQVNLEVANEDEKCLGGCKVQTRMGDITYDNTLDARLGQCKSELRSKVASIIFEEV